MVRFIFASVVVCALALSTGCQMSASAGGNSPQKAVLVTGNGGSEIFLPSTESGKVVMLSTSGTTKVCPECEADAAKYFETGELVEKCPMCGATRKVLTLPPTSVGHQ